MRAFFFTGWKPALKPIAALYALSLLLPSASRADEVYTFIVKKQEEKASSRWTLGEWLKTRDRMRLMDLWLALHSPTPYEFFLGGDLQWASRTGLGNYTAWRGQAAAYATIFGLEIEREFAPINQTIGQFNLRIFGYNDKGTNITLHGGLRSRTSPSAFRSGLAGVSMTIYITKFFGIDGQWRHYFAAVPNGSGATYVGNRFDGGAFIDFSFLRVYGKYFQETDVPRTGALAGVRLYF